MRRAILISAAIFVAPLAATVVLFMFAFLDDLKARVSVVQKPFDGMPKARVPHISDIQKQASKVITADVGAEVKGERGFTTLYSDEFRDHYPTRGRRFELGRYQLEAPVVVWDQNHLRKMTVSRTRGDKYGYEQQKCIVTIEGESLKRPRPLSVLGFRTVDSSWITGKLILIKLDIGHVAGVEAIYDVEREKIVYCESVSYIVYTEQNGPATGRQPDHFETKRVSSQTGSIP